MATSGSTDFNLTRDQIIDMALEILQVKAAGETADSNDVTSMALFLNSMIKGWQHNNLLADKRRVAFVFLEKGKDVYSLGEDLSGGDDHATDSYITTFLNGALAASATSVTVDSTSGMTASDYIGFTKSDGTLDWDTISSVDSSTTLTLTTGVTAAIADNTRIYTHTNQINRPVKVFECRRRELTTSSTSVTDTPCRMLSHKEYWDLSTKDQNTQFTGLMYDRQRDSGKLYVWPGVSSVNSIAVISYSSPVEDFDASGNNPDFTQEWLLPLVYNLAAETGPLFGVEGPRLQQIKQIAEQKLWDVLAFDGDDGSIFFEPWDRE